MFYASLYLNNKAFKWIEPYLANFKENKDKPKYLMKPCDSFETHPIDSFFFLAI